MNAAINVLSIIVMAVIYLLQNSIVERIIFTFIFLMCDFTIEIKTIFLSMLITSGSRVNF
jgi:hypothetical protein